mmetsp:Transcript_3101/g.11205  ORF Transcript_3101/g.11205 Transcript_3101/m.11205 type:complete len:284 (+) Transcript_3101:5620-6471(+)
MHPSTVSSAPTSNCTLTSSNVNRTVDASRTAALTLTAGRRPLSRDGVALLGVFGIASDPGRGFVSRTPGSKSCINEPSSQNDAEDDADAVANLVVTPRDASTAMTVSSSPLDDNDAASSSIPSLRASTMSLSSTYATGATVASRASSYRSSSRSTSPTARAQPSSAPRSITSHRPHFDATNASTCGASISRASIAGARRPRASERRHPAPPSTPAPPPPPADDDADAPDAPTAGVAIVPPRFTARHDICIVLSPPAVDPRRAAPSNQSIAHRLARAGVRTPRA